MVYSPDRDGARARARAGAPARRALLVGERQAHRARGEPLVIGRSRDCDLVLDDPNVSRRHAELRREGDGWGRRPRLDQRRSRSTAGAWTRPRCSPGDEITLGLTDLDFELE